MARAGRKRKQGKREMNGRLKRVAVTFDRGTERTQAMQALYGPDGADAIGRAYRAGLLGEGNEAKALLDMARRVSNAYWQAYATGTYTCALGDRTHGSVIELDHERIRRREEWLNASLASVRTFGSKVDKAFRQLVIDVNPDAGPRWLDDVIYQTRRGHSPEAKDMACLANAIMALENLT